MADPAHQLDDGALDSLTDRVEACLAAMPEPTPAQAVAAQCLPGPVPRAVYRDGFAVLVPPDWYPSACHPGQQLFPCQIDPSLCDAAHLKEKGEVPDPRCPTCACRAIVQGNAVIVTAPNLQVYGSELVRLVSACDLVWVDPLLACASTYP